MVDDFGARIAKLRKARKLSQRALADRAKALDPNLRLSHSALGNYERLEISQKIRYSCCWIFPPIFGSKTARTRRKKGWNLPKSRWHCLPG